MRNVDRKCYPCFAKRKLVLSFACRATTVITRPLECERALDSFERWRGTYTFRIVTSEFRENLQWAVVVPGDGERSQAVTQLLSELSTRGIVIRNSLFEIW